MQKFIYIAIIVSFLHSCKSKNKAVEESKSPLIEITSKQFDTENMALGRIEQRPFEEIINAKGYIMPLPSGKAQVSVPVAGTVQKINCSQGQYVSQGQTLLSIAGSDVIDLQKDFAETSARLRKTKSEYERSKSLVEEKVDSQKGFIALESEYKATLAQYSALKLKLSSIGLNTQQIENGNIASAYHVCATISGYVSQLNISLGQFLDRQSSVLEIINTNSLQLKLAVFADNISKIKVGQKVKYKLNGKECFATINRVGATVNEETKAIECYASITNNGGNATKINNAYTDAQIVVYAENFSALPSEALLKVENKYYIFLLEKKKEKDIYCFRKIEANLGRRNAEFVEILNKDIAGELITKGIYNINME